MSVNYKKILEDMLARERPITIAELLFLYNFCFAISESYKHFLNRADACKELLEVQERLRQLSKSDDVFDKSLEILSIKDTLKNVDLIPMKNVGRFNKIPVLKYFFASYELDFSAKSGVFLKVCDAYVNLIRSGHELVDFYNKKLLSSSEFENGYREYLIDRLMLLSCFCFMSKNINNFELQKMIETFMDVNIDVVGFQAVNFFHGNVCEKFNLDNEREQEVLKQLSWIRNF